ncbi:MAG: UDP-N-acetylmuramate dehydrogenase [Patescibacteria group bacterium]|jgi:UDP-N-acetylmuramate dehydrogenase
MKVNSSSISKILKDVKFNKSLSAYTTFKIGGKAKYFFIAKNNEDVVKAVDYSRNNSINYFVLGSGSNILFCDKGFDGLVIKMENKDIEFNGDLVKSESGIKLQKLIQLSILRNLSGLEHLIGIPGTLGGGIAGNIGTPTEWIEKCIKKVEIVNNHGQIEIIDGRDCDFSYRNSRFKNNGSEIILSAVLKLSESSPSEIRRKIKYYLEKRQHQPANLPCAGSIFKNPPNKKAWEIIDKLGLRGKKIGGAQVSPEHANFIINSGEAKAEDVVMLISYIKQQARDQFGIQLQEEIKYVGF